MKAVLVASVLVLTATAVSAYDSGYVKGNDTGGIIPWSCETEAFAVDIAAGHCGSYGKYPRITSVHRQYGDYIAFSCLWTPYIARFQIPGVPTRSVCKSSPPRGALQTLGLAVDTEVAPASGQDALPTAETAPAPARGGTWRGAH